MPNVLPTLNEHIRKQARRDLKPIIAETRKRTAEHRRSIAALKREVSFLRKELAFVKRNLPASPKPISENVPTNARLRIDGLKAHRAKLGFSAKDYGKLLGVSGLTVYKWEAGKSKPRRLQLPRIISVRGIGKREATQRLESLAN